MRLLSLSVILGFLLIGISGGAEDAAPPPAGNPTAPLAKDQKEYVDKTSRLNTLTNRIIEHEKRFLEVVRWKAEAKDPAAKKRWINELNHVAAERNKDVEAFNRIRMDVKLRYPNQGVALDRHYDVRQKKSVEQLEGVAGLDELLTRTKKMIDKKYQGFLLEEEKKNNLRPTVLKAGDEDKPKRLRLEK